MIQISTLTLISYTSRNHVKTCKTLRSCKKVQVGKDQEKAQKKTPTPKTKVGKNQTNNQVLIP